jgi:hypothetical protein
MEPKHRVAGSTKKHSGNDPKYMQNDTGPKQAVQKALTNISGSSSTPKPLQKKPAFYK